jgi:uncharacterized protein (TIGR02996 family)
MTDADALLDAIFAYPEDDLPRLVYADWLSEHGQEAYGEFIRLQCAVAREKPFSPAANELWKGIGRVWRQLEDEWWPILQAAPGLDAYDFQRGFLRGRLELDEDEFRQWVPLWYPTYFIPPVAVRLYTFWDAYPEELGDFCRVCFDLFYELELRDSVPAHLFERASFRRLRVLDVSGMYADPSAFAAIAANPTLTSLRRLLIADELGDRPEVKRLRERFGPAVQVVEGTYAPDME